MRSRIWNIYSLVGVLLIGAFLIALLLSGNTFAQAPADPQPQPVELLIGQYGCIVRGDAVRLDMSLTFKATGGIITGEQGFVVSKSINNVQPAAVCLPNTEAVETRALNLGCASGGVRLSDNTSVPDGADLSFICSDDRSNLINAMADLSIALLATQKP